MRLSLFNRAKHANCSKDAVSAPFVVRRRGLIVARHCRQSAFRQRDSEFARNYSPPSTVMWDSVRASVSKERLRRRADTLSLQIVEVCPRLQPFVQLQRSPGLALYLLKGSSRVGRRRLTAISLGKSLRAQRSSRAVFSFIPAWAEPTFIFF